MFLFLNIFSIISNVFSIVGIICGFSGIYALLYIASGITLMNSFMQVIFGVQKNFITEIATIIVGVIISLIFKIPMLIAIAFALCFAELIMYILGIIMMGKKMH